MERKENQPQLAITGERMVSQLIDYSHAHEDVYDHLHRYAKAMDLVIGKDVLDIASGEGYGSNLLARISNSVIGVDISQEAIEFAAAKYKQPNLKFSVGSADAIPLPDCSVDVVVSFETLEHHDKHDEMLSEIKRVLRTGGVLIMSTPDKDNYKDKGGPNDFHVKELNLDEFKSLISRYFQYQQMFFQRYVQASLIVSESKSLSFKEFQGDFNKIINASSIEFPHYNICIASDEPLEADYNSIFHNYKYNLYNSDYVEHIRNNEANKIIKSKTYKLGNAIVSPLRFFHKLFK